MKTLNVNIPGSAYPILIGRGLLSQPELITAHLPLPEVVVVSNEVVAPLYLPLLKSGLVARGVKVLSVVLPDGEAHKNRDSLNRIHDEMLKHRCERKTTVVALGGGVVGDLAGFAAATFLRGVPLIQVPTTLLAQVDSSVGGKTGINHPLGKNLIGSFHQPTLVLADTDTLNTLPPREFHAGLAEVVKYGLIRDPEFLHWLDQNLEALVAREPAALAHAIYESCRNKAQVVAADPLETTGLRALLNLGHTFGHAIEAGAGYGTWLHGEAVGMGTLLAADLSAQMGWISDADVALVVRLFKRCGLPLISPNLGVDRYLELMASDKKVEAGKIRYVLLKALGEAVLTREVPENAVRAVLCGRFVGNVG
jgi:3-dehydroquinate synthase